MSITCVSVRLGAYSPFSFFYKVTIFFKTWHGHDGVGRHLRRHTYQFPIISNNNNVIDACIYDVRARVAPLKYRVVMLCMILHRKKARKFCFDHLFLERVK